jgi:anti-sigma factor RsiW
VPHPDALLSEAYGDGQLIPDVHAYVEEHLRQCAHCRTALAGLERLHQLLHDAPPDLGHCHSEGEFWAQLAARLPAQRPTVWGWLPYLPPFLLGALGTLIEGALSLVVIVYTLARLGVLPSLGEPMAAQLAHSLSWASEQPWCSWMGSANCLALHDAALHWAALSGTMQDTLLLVAGVVLIGISLGLVVALYFSWAMCWERVTKS